jgi:hypothetical protein
VILYFCSAQSPLEVSAALQLMNADTIDLSSGLWNADFLLFLSQPNNQPYQFVLFTLVREEVFDHL